jgi:hypothetical protein
MILLSKNSFTCSLSTTRIKESTQSSFKILLMVFFLIPLAVRLFKRSTIYYTVLYHLGLFFSPVAILLFLVNNDHKVTEGIYVAGTLAGWRSQLSIAAGSGAAVATDILTLWNNGIDSQSHDSIKKI